MTPEQKAQLVEACARAYREHKKKRLEIASLLFASDPNYSASEAVRGADLLMRTNEGMPTTYCKDEAK